MKKILVVISFILLTLVFSKPLFAEEATQGSDTVRDKVKEKIEQARLNPKAYIGTVTDKLTDTLQIKNILGEIQLISVKNEVVFVKTGKSATKVTFNDVAIGDFIVAMGLTNGNGVLEAKRILVTQPLESPERKIVYGEIQKMEAKTIAIKDKKGNELVLNFPRKWKGPEIKELNKNDTVIVVYTTEENKLTIRTIQVVSATSPTPTPKQ